MENQVNQLAVKNVVLVVIFVPCYCFMLSLK